MENNDLVMNVLFSEDERLVEDFLRQEELVTKTSLTAKIQLRNQIQAHAVHAALESLLARGVARQYTGDDYTYFQHSSLPEKDLRSAEYDNPSPG